MKAPAIKLELDSVALARRAHAFAANRVREMMQRSQIMLAAEDRDCVHRFMADAFCLGFLACLETIEDERAMRDGTALVKVLHGKSQKRANGMRKPGGVP